MFVGLAIICIFEKNIHRSDVANIFCYLSYMKKDISVIFWLNKTENVALYIKQFIKFASQLKNRVV